MSRSSVAGQIENFYPVVSQGEPQSLGTMGWRWLPMSNRRNSRPRPRCRPMKMRRNCAFDDSSAEGKTCMSCGNAQPCQIKDGRIGARSRPTRPSDSELFDPKPHP